MKRTATKKGPIGCESLEADRPLRIWVSCSRTLDKNSLIIVPSDFPRDVGRNFRLYVLCEFVLCGANIECHHAFFLRTGITHIGHRHDEQKSIAPHPKRMAFSKLFRLLFMGSCLAPDTLY